MVAGPTWHVAICNECVELCTEIFAEDDEPPAR
jgi:ATP-dependent protease Clp ATPase subunit